jgi:hypothetical protein
VCYPPGSHSHTLLPWNCSSAEYVTEQDLGENPITTDVFTEIVLETEQLSAGGDVLLRKFYLVDVETFKKPILVIPNIGRSHSQVQVPVDDPKVEWADQFIQFVDLPHAQDEAQMAATDDEQGQEEEEEDGDTEEEEGIDED